MGDAPDGIETVRTSFDDPRAAPLLRDLEREYVSRYGPGATQEMSRYPLVRFTPERGGAFLLLLADGEAVAGGAYMRDENGDAEVKRMWTRADHRRRGLAGRVLRELEADARDRGYRRMVLSTGWAQPEAVRLYVAAGWTPDVDLEGDWRERGWVSFHRELDPARPSGTSG